MHIHRIGDVTVLNDYIEVPGVGFLPVNAFVLHAEQPVVIDSGLSTIDKDFVSGLAEVLDPADVRWLWITHPDRDHTGGMWNLLQAAPAARLVTTFLGLGIMSCEWAIHLTGSSSSIRAKRSMSVIAGCRRSAHRYSTVPQPPDSSTIGQGRCSARIALAHRCRRLS
jgi:hypothetical protein